MEAAYYDSPDARSASNPAVPNSELRFLAGYQRQLATEFTVGAQYYTEIMKDYSAYKATLPPGFPLQDRLRHMLALRLTKFVKYQTWRLSLFSFYSPSDQDAMLIPELWHAFSDRLSLTVGTNLFAGRRRTTALGQYDRNSNLYLVLRYDF